MLCLRLSALVVAGVAIAGCATPPPERVSWGEETQVDERNEGRRLQTQADFDAAADTELTVARCEARASALLSSKPKDAAMMMRGCMRRSDFLSLIAFNSAPWKSMRFTEADMPLILSVAMRRGGQEIAEDFRQLRVPVSAWDMFLEEEQRPDQRLVTARVLVLDERRDGAEVVSVVRLYGVRRARETKTFASEFSNRTYEYETGRQRRNISPIGLTLEVRSKQPLPRDRRVQIIARYEQARSERLLASQRAKAEKSTEVLSSKDIAEREPLPGGVVTLLLTEAESEAQMASAER